MRAACVQECSAGAINCTHALLIQGDDELGALAGIHQKLYEADNNVYASSGVTDGSGSYGYLIYVKEDDFERAAATLGV